MQNLKLSVCVCTFNRSKRLFKFLSDTVEEKIFSDHKSTELLIIDNNSSDDTKKIVQLFSDRLPIKYFFEQKQGLSNARNCALKNAKGSWIIFTDDDVCLTALWLSEYRKAISYFTEVDFLGGRIKPNWGAGRPSWLKDDKLALLSGVLSHYDLGEDNFLYQAQHPLPYGASFAVSKKLAQSLGEFNTKLGVSGHNAGRGEETDYLQRATEAGYQGAYIGKSVCFHDFIPQRFSSNYLFKHGIQKGLAHAITEPELMNQVSSVAEILFVLKGVWQLLKGRRDKYYQCITNLGLLRGLRQARNAHK